MKKLLVLGILVIVGSVGYAYWHESKMVMMEEPWPPTVLLERHAATGDVHTYLTVVNIQVKSLIAAKAPVNDATLLLGLREKVGKQLGAGAYEVTSTFLNVRFDTSPDQRRIFALLGLGAQLEQLKDKSVSFIEYPTGRREITHTPQGLTSNFILVNLAGTDNPDLYPTEPISPGRDWSARKSTLLVKYVFQGFEKLDEHRCARIGSVLSTDAAGGQQTMIEGSGTTYLDYSIGVMVKDESHVTVTVPRQVVIVLDTSTQLVNESPAAPPS